MVPPASYRVSRALHYSGSLTPLSAFIYMTLTFFGWPSHAIQLASISLLRSSTPYTSIWFGLFPVRSPLLRESISFFLFLRVLRCFSSPGCLLLTYFVQLAVMGLLPTGFPHSDIHGSSLACSSPSLFVAGYVLLRLLAPRHPPYALSYLTSLCSFQSSVFTSLLPEVSLRCYLPEL